MTEEIKRIYKNLAALYDGQPWFGDNISSILAGVSSQMAAERPGKLNHSIAEIISHLIAWHYFVIEKMKGNETYEVWETELNWPPVVSLTDEEWQKAKDDLQKSYALLLQQIERMPESLLNSAVSGRKYNFRLMLQGIAQHDIYHAGQMAIIKKLVS
jgi:uncharacterized damage-inducible protein DinB